MYLVDTNVWLELLLEQDKADEVQQFFKVTKATHLSITEFSLYSVGVVLNRLKKDQSFQDFLTDTVESSGVMTIRLDLPGLLHLLRIRERFKLDFDDSYQYAVAEKHGLTLVSFDTDFDRTDRGRKTPAELLKT